MGFRIRKITWEEAPGLAEGDIMTMQEAAEALGITVQGVQSALERGRFTLVENPDSHGAHQGRRLLLRKEVLARKRKRAAG